MRHRHRHWTRDQARQAVDDTVNPLRDTVAALEVFGDAPEPTEKPPEKPPEEPTGEPAPATLGLTYEDGLGSSVHQVARVGSARPMVQTYGEGSLASLDGQADEVTATSENILPAMCVFTKTGC